MGYSVLFVNAYDNIASYIGFKIKMINGSEFYRDLETLDMHAWVKEEAFLFS